MASGRMPTEREPLPVRGNITSEGRPRWGKNKNRSNTPVSSVDFLAPPVFCRRHCCSDPRIVHVEQDKEFGLAHMPLALAKDHLALCAAPPPDACVSLTC